MSRALRGVLVALLVALPLLTPVRATRAAAKEEPIERKDGHRVWKLTSYLQGTADEIRKQLNGQVDHFIASRDKQKQRIADLTAKLDTAKAHGQNVLIADEQYQKLEKAANDADAAKEAARKSGTAQQRLDAGAAYVKAKAAADQRRKKLVDDDPNVLALSKEMVEAKQQLKALEMSLGKEEAWRRDLVDAIRTSFTLTWPMRKGQVGTLGVLTPRRSAGADSFEADYRCAELVNTEGVHEGIAVVGQVIHPEHLLLTGVDAKWEVGKPVAMNRAFEVVGFAEGDVPRGTIHMRRAAGELGTLAGDVDELMTAVDRAPDVPLDEMDALVRAALKKDNPHRWGTPAAMIAALPADLRPRAGEKMPAERVQKAERWLSNELVGDTVDLSLTLQTMRPTDAGVDVLATTADLGGGRRHYFTLSCGESLRAKAEKIKAGQPSRVSGTIKSIHMDGDGTIDVRLADASFQ